MWQPQNVEAVLHGMSLVRWGVALLVPALQGQRGTGGPLHMACMALLAVLTSVLDRCSPAWFKDHPVYTFRACGHAGLAQGLLALPSLATSISLATRSWWWHQVARLFVASSFQVLLWFSWTAANSNNPSNSSASSSGGDMKAVSGEHGPRGSPVAAPAVPPAIGSAPDVPDQPAASPLFKGGRRARIPPGPRPVFSRGGAAATRLFLAASAAGCLLSAASALIHAARPPPPTSPQLLLPGSVFELPYDIITSAWAVQGALLLATAPALHHLAAALPRSFTPGEAGILLQAVLTLLAGSAAYLAGAVKQGLMHALWSPHVVQPDPGMHVPAFCMLVLFWVLLLAACCAVALGGGKQGQVCETAGKRQHPGAAATARPAAAFESVILPRHPKSGGNARRRGRAAPAAASVAVTAEIGGGTAGVPSTVIGPLSNHLDGDNLDRVLAVAARAGAAAGAAVALVMLADLALWVLGRFIAASSRPRLATLAYWFGCLAVAVPFMYVVSKESAAREQDRQQKVLLEQQEQEQERMASEMGPLGWDESQAAVRGAQGSQTLLNAPSEHDAAAEREGSERKAYTGRSSNQGRRQGDGIAAVASASVPCGYGTQATDATAAAESQVQGPGRSSGLCTTECVAVATMGPKEPPLVAPRSPSALVPALSRIFAVPHIVMRKGYHLLAILLFLPAFGWDVRMLQASLAVAGGVLVLVELLRCLGPAGVRRAIGGFMADFADARDSGPLYVTHFTLLLGIAVPVWLCDPVCGAAAGAMMAGLYGSDAAEPMLMPANAEPAAAAPLSAAAARLLPSCRAVLGLSGLVSLGSGDTAAACVGYLLGRRRLFRGGKKTWEGTLSGAAAMLASWAVVVWWMDVRWALTWHTWGALAAVTCGVAMLEAVTQQLDNVMVPVYYLTHLVLTMTGN